MEESSGVMEACGRTIVRMGRYWRATASRNRGSGDNDDTCQPGEGLGETAGEAVQD